jgi:hypothetical protein
VYVLVQLVQGGLEPPAQVADITRQKPLVKKFEPVQVRQLPVFMS